MSTVTSGRILKGQLRNQPGEEQITVMETLDNNALSKVNVLEILELILEIKFFLRRIILMRKLLIQQALQLHIWQE